MAFTRTTSLDDDPRFLDLLARVVQRSAAATHPPLNTGSTTPA
jgi:hypothetical protein